MRNTVGVVHAYTRKSKKHAELSTATRAKAGALVGSCPTEETGSVIVAFIKITCKSDKQAVSCETLATVYRLRARKRSSTLHLTTFAGNLPFLVHLCAQDTGMAN